MSNIDKRALRKAAMHAKTEDDWGCDADNFHDKATPDAVLALLDELEAAEKRIAELRDWNAGLAQESFTYQQRVAELLSENAGLKNSVENASGCINAAYGEGLIDALSESNDERLVDLVNRRLLFAYLPVETPATNEELIAIGDWVLREQLEDGTRAIKTLNRRIADQRGIILSARNFISEYAQNGDVGAAEFVKILDSAAGIGVKGE
ncbi:ead/Ea22-like family protein [Citrobacter freundii]|uniref:ead/Ea22-like family protein n=1 Tax=Citrobacter freundii TaxID=546 RepID=UPI0024318EBD|nr:ead/Ea22-like family protein [Citrobacter freundii]WFW90607.1 ead/Ea22-like family protein [Citrobacter freundii]